MSSDWSGAALGAAGCWPGEVCAGCWVVDGCVVPVAQAAAALEKARVAVLADGKGQCRCKGKATEFWSSYLPYSSNYGRGRLKFRLRRY